ncbi:hypothetical protein BDV93DRAFT_282201 [Ceratobasidium sp. AG-I]|nr:hypothetical protein BDV93DRAFT_282201 [Ceratobasidium sp. AG-I]
MDNSFLKFSPRTAHSPPTVDFTFANPNATQPKRALVQGSPSLNGQARPGNSSGAQRKTLGPGSSDALTMGRVPLPNTSKPGPIFKSELSSGTNAFKLRADYALNNRNAPSNNLLRQEVFKSAHTLVPSTQQPSKMLPGLLSSAPRIPLSEDLPVKSSAKSFARSKPVPVESAKQNSTLKLESPISGQRQPRTKSIRIRDDESGGYPERRTPSLPLTMDDRSSTPGSTGDRNGSDNYLAETPKHTPQFSPIPNEHFQPVVPQTSSRHSIDRSTPSAALGDTDDMERNYQMLQAAANVDRDRNAKLKARVRQLEIDKVELEERLALSHSQYAESLKSLSAQVATSRVELNGIGEYLSSSTAQTKQLSNDIGALRRDIGATIASAESAALSLADKVGSKGLLAGEIFAGYEDLHSELTSQISEQHQTIDLLRDELSIAKGNFTQSMDREKDLQASLVTMGEKHANIADCLTTLHAQREQLSLECSKLRSSEDSATKHVEDLEQEVARLITDNNRTEALLSENENAFSQKLKHLEDENDTVSQDLQTARSDLTREHNKLKELKNTQDEALAQLEFLRGQKEDLTQKIALLDREVDLKTQSLSAAQESKESFEAQLVRLDHDLIQSRAENNRLQGRLAETERTYSVRVDELKYTLESALERENTLKGDTIKLNNNIASLQDKLKGAMVAYARVDALESTMSKKQVEVERLNIEIAAVKSQLLKTEESCDAQVLQSNSTLAAIHVAREREAILRTEVETLRGFVEDNQQAAQKTSIKTAQDEVEIRQLKNQLAKEQEYRYSAEQKLDASTRDRNELQAEHKALNEISSAREKALRLSMDDIQAKAQRLETERETQEEELKTLRRELSETVSAKLTLEALAGDFQSSIQQDTTTRQECRQTIENQESKIAALSDCVFERKAEIQVLEQRLAGLDSRCAEYKADANTHRAAAETARTTNSIIEDRFKQKELELELVRVKLQAIETMPVVPTFQVDDTLQPKVAELEATIELLKTKVRDAENNTGTISERYQDGKLEFIGKVTNGILQEKNKTVNNLKGEIKRKENEIETFKTNVAGLKESLAKQIKQTVILKAKLTPNSGLGADPQNWHPFVEQFSTISSSPLSCAAPDHDEPVPDTPVTPLKPKETQAFQPQQQQDAQAYIGKQQQQQYRTFAQMDVGSGNGVDEIQEFEEPAAQGSSSASRKRPAAEIEAVEEMEVEESEAKRKAPGKNKKVGKPPKDTSNPKGLPAVENSPNVISTRAKTTKRRKGC